MGTFLRPSVSNIVERKEAKMLNKKKLKPELLLISALTVIFLLQSSDAFARHRSSNRYRRAHSHRSVSFLPHNYISFGISGLRFYYGEGTSHRKSVRGYVLANPPGYAVVPTPVVYAPQAVVVIPSVSAYTPKKADKETVVVNIPNSDGSYTPVILEKFKNGYIGPQGEYYTANPTVEQLKALYGK